MQSDDILKAIAFPSFVWTATDCPIWKHKEHISWLLFNSSHQKYSWGPTLDGRVTICLNGEVPQSWKGEVSAADDAACRHDICEFNTQDTVSAFLKDHLETVRGTGLPLQPSYGHSNARAAILAATIVQVPFFNCLLLHCLSTISACSTPSVATTASLTPHTPSAFYS